MKHIGETLLAWMNIKQVQQKDLAHALNLSPQQMGHLLKCDASKWKLSYFDAACRFLKLHPKHFFEEWKDNGKMVYGNMEHNSILGNSIFSVGAEIDLEELKKDYTDRLSEKDARIKALEEIIALQRDLIRVQDGESKDAR